MTKYRTWIGEVIEVQCVKETDSTVWIQHDNGSINKHLKRSNHDCYLDTYAEAVAHVINEAQIKVDAAETSLNYYQSELAKVKAKFKKVAA